MGLGDEIMAAGHAMRRHAETGQRVAILDRSGRTRRHPLWDGNPAIVQVGEGAGATITNGSGCRPYLEYPWSRQTGQTFTDWRARDHRAKIYLTPAETRMGKELSARHGRYAVIEPNIKPTANPNKDWGFERYQAVVNMLRAAHPDIVLVQAAPRKIPVLDGVVPVETSTIREACGVLGAAACYIGSEGALHHASAALDVPAVVLFGAHAPVDILGYPDHVNLGTSSKPCGRWEPCRHCATALGKVTPDDVVAAVCGVLFPDGALRDLSESDDPGDDDRSAD